MKTKILSLLVLAAFWLCGCDSLLERPPLTNWTDENFWSSEANLKLYASGFYTHTFIGYNSGWTTTAAAHYGFQFSDDILYNGNQEQFESTVPNERGSTASISDTGSETLSWLNSYSGLNWNFSWIRKANVMIDRIESKMGNLLSADSKSHWMGIARFFRAIEYAGLVSTFGDVPYFDREIGSAELDEIYKPRTPRNEVMDAVYNDFIFALENVKGDLGSQLEVNTYVVAGFVSRWALFEGSWQKYHENNSARAQKFFELAVRAGDLVINSGRFSFDTDFRSLFGSESLGGKREVILYRHYDSNYSLTHSMASQCNLIDGQYYGPTLALVKSFICSDGSDWQTSLDSKNKDFTMSNLIKTRDSRFEASFYKNTTYRSLASCIYVAKFIHRDGHKYVDEGLASPPSQYTSSYNTNDYPVMRYAEVVLNYVEAKAEIGNCTQSDIDKSINAIRNRPLAADAIAAGVQKTAPLNLSNLPSSPDRGDVSQLLWEIRRERRMEFAFEFGRLKDLRRWKKLEYMDSDINPDLLRGTWVTLDDAHVKNLPSGWQSTLKDLMGVVDMNGNKTLFNGTNASIEGFYYRTVVVNRLPFLDVFNVNPYLAPVGRDQRINYHDKGYNLAQTKGWPDEF